MIGKSDVVKSSLGEIIIDGTFARAEIVVDETPTQQYFHFYKEDDTWKFDLTALLPLANRLFQQQQEESGLDNEVFITKVVEYTTTKQVDPEVWNP